MHKMLIDTLTQRTVSMLQSYGLCDINKACDLIAITGITILRPLLLTRFNFDLSMDK